MKRLLLPLLAALALPTSVNAEIVYLRCTPNTEKKIDFSITINEENSSSLVSTPLRDGSERLNKGTLFATSDSFIVKIIEDSLYRKYEISRLDGSYIGYMGSAKYPDKIPESKYQNGSCIKEEKKKTLF